MKYYESKKYTIEDIVDKNCKKCFGKGYTGIVTKINKPVYCSCLSKGIKKIKERTEVENI